jgi:hypothetical protein
MVPRALWVTSPAPRARPTPFGARWTGGTAGNFYATAATGTTYGVWGGNNNTAGTGWGVYSQGNMAVAPIVATSGASKA